MEKNNFETDLKKTSKNTQSQKNMTQEQIEKSYVWVLIQQYRYHLGILSQDKISKLENELEIDWDHDISKGLKAMLNFYKGKTEYPKEISDVLELEGELY